MDLYTIKLLTAVVGGALIAYILIDMARHWEE